MKKYGAVKILINQEPTTSRTHNNQNTHKHTTHKTKNNIQHHGPPKPPAPNGSNFTGECNCRMSRDWSRSLQHGDELLIDNTNFPFIYLTIILGAAAQRAHWLKVSFFKDTSSDFFVPLHRNEAH